MADLKNDVPEEVLALKDRIECLFGRVLIWPCDVEYTDKESLLIRPNTAQDAPETGVVVAVSGPYRHGGELIDPVLEPGDVVLFGKYSGYGIADDLFLSIRETDVMNRLHGVKVKPRGEGNMNIRTAQQANVVD